MGQLNEKYENLSKDLKQLGEENLQSCYSPKEIVKLAFEDVTE